MAEYYKNTVHYQLVVDLEDSSDDPEYKNYEISITPTPEWICYCNTNVEVPDLLNKNRKVTVELYHEKFIVEALDHEQAFEYVLKALDRLLG